MLTCEVSQVVNGAGNGGGVFEKFTGAVRSAIAIARQEADQAASAYIEPEHLLLGLLRADEALARRFLRTDAAVGSIRNQVRSHSTAGGQTTPGRDLTLSKLGKWVLAYAAEEAERRSDQHIGTEHLLVGLLLAEDTFAAEILRTHGLSVSIIRKDLKAIDSPSQAPESLDTSRATSGLGQAPLARDGPAPSEPSTPTDSGERGGLTTKPCKVKTIDSTLQVFTDRNLNSVAHQLGKDLEIQLGATSECEGREWVEVESPEGPSGFALGASIRSHTNMPAKAYHAAPLPSTPVPFSPTGVLNHGGEPLGKDLMFLSLPPYGIGRILSANSSLKASDAERFAPKGGTGRLDGAIRWLDTHSPDSIRSCSYVGENGLAAAATRDGGATVFDSKDLLFSRAVALWVDETSHFTGTLWTSYTGTTYSFLWVDSYGRALFSIAGTHKYKSESPPAGHQLHFGRAAERAWTVHYLKGCRKLLDSGGSVSFDYKTVRRMGGDDFDSGRIEVSNCYLQTPERVLAKDQIASVELSGDCMRVAGAGKAEILVGRSRVANFLALYSLLRDLWNPDPKAEAARLLRRMRGLRD
jgi:hypothetical protein